MYTKETDVELLHAIIVEQDHEAEVTLFSKYQPFIYKYYRQACKQIFGFSQVVSFEDYTSEAYFQFKKLLDYYDPSKVDGNWRIIQIFGFYMKNLNSKYVRKNKSNPTYITFEATESADTTEVTHHALIEKDTFVSEVVEEHSYRVFLDTLPLIDRNLLLDREKSVRETGNPEPYRVLAERYDRSIALLQCKVKKLFKDYQAFVGHLF